MTQLGPAPDREIALNENHPDQASLTSAGRELLLVTWNQTALDYPRGRCLHQLIEAQVARTPDAIALIVGTDRFTYRNLNTRANQAAYHLRRLGVKPEVLVAICVERSLEMVIGLLAVLKAGGAYVPLDPVYPKERLAFILEDAQATVLLTQERLVAGLPPHQAQVVCLDTLNATGESGENPRSGVAADNLAYVIFTSGSTGRPKGVAIEHRSTVAFAEWARTVFSAEEFAGVMFSTSVCFDLSVFELFVTLSCGGKVILAENALQLPRLPAVSEVTLVNTVPSALAGLLRGGPLPPSVQTVNLAGEPLLRSLADKIYQNASVRKVYDLYGPSEDTTYSTFALRTRGGIATIGRPIANTQVYLLDAQLQPVPLGEIGELYLGGEGLARGYLRRPELTAEKFVPNPFSAQPEARLYRTGDRARYWPDGNIEFLGRLDYQVKIRGFRIELGEIEAVLESVPGLDQAVVVALDEAGEKRLAAYVVGAGRQAVSVGDLRSALRAKLPEYMMPAAFVVLKQMPLTPNGKVDRKALPAPNAGASEETFVAPRTPAEKVVAKIWRDVLGLKQVGIHDNFFDLGGHSLLAIQVISRFRDECHRELSMAELFQTPTVAELATKLANNGETKPSSEIPRADRQGRLPLSFIQQQLWFLHQLEPASAAYHVSMAVRVAGPLHTDALRQALQVIVQRHEILRTTFPSLEGSPVQVVASSSSPALTLVDLRETPAPEREAEAQRLLVEESDRAFDLARGPLLRVTLLRLEQDKHLLLVVMHHIISDGWSLGIFFGELGKLYDGFCAGTPVSLPELPVQYADYAQWEQQTWRKQSQEVRYWKEKLTGAPARLELPTDRPIGPGPALRAAQRTLALPESLMQSLVALGRREGSTPFMTMMTALVIALHQWTRQAEFVLGTVAAGRGRREIETLIGCFMNFLPLRVKLSGADSALEVLARVKTVVLEAQAHQDCPFEQMVQAVNPERHRSENPLYNVAFLLQNYPNQLLATERLQTTLLPLEAREALLDLRFVAEEIDAQMSLTCEFREALFDPTTIDALLAFVGRTLAALAREPQRKVADFEKSEALDAQAAAARLTGEKPGLAITATFTVEPLEESLRFWTQKLNLPATIAFAPYNQVFQQLLDPGSVLGLNRGMNVVLIRLEDWLKQETAAVERNACELVGALQTAAARAATPCLVCLCPASKSAAARADQVELFHRVETGMARELAHVRHLDLVTSAELLALYPVAEYDDPRSDELGHIPYTPAFYAALGTLISRKLHALNRAPHKVIVLDCDQTLWAGVCGEDGAAGVFLDPPRLALQTFMRAQHDAGRLLCQCSKNSEEDVAAVFSAHPEMPLRQDHFAARRVNWLPKSENLKALAAELRLDLDSFIFVDDSAVECAEVEAHCPQVLTLLLPKPEQIPDFLHQCWAFDHGSVTDEDRLRTVSYRQNRQREEFQAAAGGLAEFIAGLGLKTQIDEMSPGQLARVAQLTQRTSQFNCTTRRRTESELQRLADSGHQVFSVSVSDRFGDYGLVGVMICRESTESLVVDTFLLSCRVLGKGVEHEMLASLGRLATTLGASRVDVAFQPSTKNQPALDFLNQTGVPVQPQISGALLFPIPTSLAARIRFEPSRKPANGLAPKSKAVHHANGSSIPGGASSLYRWIAQEAASGHEVLAAMEAGAPPPVEMRGDYAAPRTKLERQLCQTWEQLLRIKRVGIRDNFFDLGGHSMMAVRLFAQISKLTGKNLPLVTLFQSPTIEQLAASLQEKVAEGSLLVPLQTEGTKPPLFLIHGAGGGILWGYANLARHLAPDQPVYGLESRGMRGQEEFSRVEDMAEHYLSELRSLQPEGPYYLGGYCFGGSVAYEMARQLRAHGDEVAFLGLIDAAAPNGSYERMPWWRPSFLPRFVRNLCYWLSDFSQLKPEERRNYYRRKAGALKSKLGWGTRPGDPREPYEDLEQFINVALFPEHELKLWQIHLRADASYVPQPGPGCATLFRTRGQPLFCSLDPAHGWGELARGGVNIQLITGAHEQIFMEPTVQCLAAQFKACLLEAQALSTPKEPLAVLA